MKITIQDCKAGEEEEIIIRCKQIDQHLLKTIYSLKAYHDKITVCQGEKIYQLPPSEIYYFDAVDNRVYAYTQQDVYETKLKLYELEALLEHTDFLRISKSTIINLSKVKNFSPYFNGRFEVCLKNAEKLVVSRQYVPHLKEKLGL